MRFREKIKLYAEQPITKQLLLDTLKEYKRPYDKIDELVKQGQLIQVKRGLYIPGFNLNMAGPENILLANYLYGPSYVSMETALSHWGFIPERVYEISSATVNLSKRYNTKTGRFSYYRLPLPYYSFGIMQVALTKKQTALIASPEKALCDKIITTSGILLRSIRQTENLLMEDFRIGKDMLRSLNTKTIAGWQEYAPQKNSLVTLVKTLNNL